MWMILTLLLSLFSLIQYKVNRGQKEEIESKNYIIGYLTKQTEVDDIDRY